MVDVSMLKQGDRVRIVDHWVYGCHQNMDGKMDKYLGKEMTVRDVISDKYYQYAWMEEDMSDRHGRGWNWFRPAIECVVDENNSFNETDFLALLT